MSNNYSNGIQKEPPHINPPDLTQIYTSPNSISKKRYYDGNTNNNTNNDNANIKNKRKNSFSNKLEHREYGLPSYHDPLICASSLNALAQALQTYAQKMDIQRGIDQIENCINARSEYAMKNNINSDHNHRTIMTQLYSLKKNYKKSCAGCLTRHGVGGGVSRQRMAPSLFTQLQNNFGIPLADKVLKTGWFYSPERAGYAPERVLPEVGGFRVQTKAAGLDFYPRYAYRI